jgi:hypothetical protein
MRQKNKIKIIWMYFTIGLIVLTVFSLLGFVFRLQIFELFNYKNNPTTENLIRIAVLSVEKKDGQRMDKYVPEALGLANFVDIASSERIFISNLMNKTTYDNKGNAYRTYYKLMIEYVMHPLFNEDYDEYQRRFQYYFPLMAEDFSQGSSWSLLEWAHFYTNIKRFRDAQYDRLIYSLNYYLPEPFVVTKENVGEAYERAYTFFILSYVYYEIGEINRFNELENRASDLMSEIEKVKKHSDMMP